MKKNDPATALYIDLTRDSAWQSQLRRSVRLYLALGSQPVNKHELENLLQRTEEELVLYLLQSEQPTAKAIGHAQVVLDMAQNALLQSEDQVQKLLQTLSADQARFYTDAAPGLPPIMPSKAMR